MRRSNLQSHTDTNDLVTTRPKATPYEPERNQKTIEKLVDGFARNAVDDIMDCFAEGATYHDVRGIPPSGAIYRGKATIEKLFIEQFRLLGDHTYENPVIMANNHSGFARWTLVLGATEDTRALRFDGSDHFLFDENGLCTAKTAWLKGQQHLARYLFRRRPFLTLREHFKGK